MNRNLLALIVLVALGAAGWINREKLIAQYAKLTGAPAAGESAQEDATPGTAVDKEGRPVALVENPATEAQEAVLKAYPALGMSGSAFNKKFLALHAEAKKSEPALLAQPDWPIRLAERTAIAMGGAPMPIATPAPAPASSGGLMGSALDKRPSDNKGSHK